MLNVQKEELEAQLATMRNSEIRERSDSAIDVPTFENKDEKTDSVTSYNELEAKFDALSESSTETELSLRSQLEDERKLRLSETSDKQKLRLKLEQLTQSLSNLVSDCKADQC
jgi:outer membrane translocation and assembly module TamA